MKNAYIKFPSREDAVAGLTTLVAEYDVAALTNDIFCIPSDSLDSLDANGVSYSLASQEDLAAAHPLWDLARLSNH